MELPVLQIIFDMAEKYFDSFSLEEVVWVLNPIVRFPPEIKDSRSLNAFVISFSGADAACGDVYF